MNLRERILKMQLLTIVLFSFIVSYGYSQNLIKNPGFESGNISPYWGTWPKVSSIANIDHNNAYEGEFCVKLEANKVYFYQPVNLEPNTTYKVSATIKTESGDNILFGVSNVKSTGGDSIIFNDINYKTDSLTFTTDESPGNKPEIYILKENGSGFVWVDSIVLIIDPIVNEPKPPGGFGKYYVSPLGSDTNTGTSPEQAWQTIGKVNNKDFGPGDQILFEAGETFNGTIILNEDDYGTLSNKVHLGSYGSGRAVINAQTGSGLIVYDCSNISVKNLNFIGDGRNEGNTGNGIVFSYCSEIIIDSVEVSGFQHSGLTVNNIGENYQITNIKAHDNGYAGICVFGIDKTSLSDIYIGHCVADNNPGDPTVLDNHSGNGIFAYEASNIIIEYCEASNNGWDMPRIGNGPGGIWVAEADSVIIQHCISHHNRTPSGADDGLGFDLDGGTTNSIIQYCLSYSNDGAGFGIFQYPGATDWYNNTVRYCISENDGNVSAPGSMLFWNGTGNNNKFQNFEFYNNVIYNANGSALAFYDHSNLNFNLRNNIFVSKISNVYNRINGENSQGNCWFSLTNDFYTDSLNFIAWAQANSQEMLDSMIIGMFANPKLINPGNSTLIDPTQLKFVDDYKLQDSSTLIDAGLDLNALFNFDPGGQDFYGSAIKKGLAFDIGVHEHSDTAIQVQQLSLSAGWNIISFRVVPQDSDMLNIVQPLIDLGVLKKVMDESGNVIEDWGSFGGWKNFIGSVHNSEGYKVNVTDDATLKIDGVAVVLAYEIPLNVGWNIISWPSANEQNGNDVFQSLINDGKLKKVMDESGNTIEDLGVYGGWKNNIGNFKPGEGYKVNVTTGCTLTIYESSVKSDEIIPEVFASSHFVPDYKGNGTDHMNINLVNLTDSGIKEGDEIGVFDGDICVGSAQIRNLFQGAREVSISIPVSAADGIEGNNGYLDGNPIIIKLFRDRVEYPLSIEPVNNSTAVFRKGSSLFAQFDILTGLKEIAPVKTAEVKCYPNPFSEFMTIELNLAADSEVQVQVLNQLGQKVKFISTKQILSNGLHKLKWDGRNENNHQVSPGIYFLRIAMDNSIFHEKVVLSK